MMNEQCNGTPEKRDRFRRTYTERHLRELQLALLDILRHVARICEQNDIPYWLDSGTLLGAVRHGGFIPWDDDIDICIRKEDLARFEKVLSQELPAHLFLQTPQSDAQRLPVRKVRNLNSFFVEYKDDFSHTYSKGIYIDIFPMEPWPSFGYRFSRFLAREYGRSNSILHTQHYYSLRACAELFYFGIRRLVCKCMWKIGGLFTGSNKYYSNILENSGNGFRHLKTTIFPLSRIDFEGESFSAPADSERYLRDLFGDYHRLPPEKDRHGHAVFFLPQLEATEETNSFQNKNNITD